MNSRELFHSVMHYGSFDRMPVWHWKGWPETETRWEREGMPRNADQAAFLGVESLPPGIPCYNFLLPRFDEEVLEETDAFRIFRQADGVVAQHFKGRSALPHYVDFTLKDRATWPEYHRRLQPSPDRIPPDLDEVIARLVATDLPLAIDVGSLAGWLRDWMGVENFCMTSVTDPDFIAEMAGAIADLVCWNLDQILPKVKVDIGWGWEDICFRSGPLVNPDLFRQAMAPGYRKIAEKLRSYGCDLYLVDCDGCIDLLLPIWLDCGVNVMFPLEIGAWNADPMAFRRQFGKDLRIIGGIDKLVLERGREAIDAEIERRKPLMADGGYIPLPDHLITPDTPLDQYRYYLDRLRELRF
ncbi:MAG TPA: uroporphyrinogen decarboxylase family protein [Candidatus Hydrogenedentes bacterium]|nr:uroporphyrinogen decarboxylase family protein [Candidatus Hydrogenedentota bacterium]HOS02592.1 uroporphyrinogen decarboxylase family protein [Candidatus Hydrogenedentota bacterium]